MTAYVLVEMDVTDPEAFEAYKAAAPAAIQAHDGAYLARGGATELLEGDQAPGRVAVLQFADADAARAWFASPEYTAARALRADAATARFILVEGVE